MPKNKLTDLRNHLFETIEMLKSGEMELKTAKAITETAQVIVNSAKVEADFVRDVGGFASDFFPALETDEDQPKRLN
jgi:hypothetical protein